MVGFLFSSVERVDIECGVIGRVQVAASGIAVLFVPSRGAFFGLRHGVLAFLGLGSVKRARGRRCKRCCFRRSIRVDLARTQFVFGPVEA